MAENSDAPTRKDKVVDWVDRYVATPVDSGLDGIAKGIDSVVDSVRDKLAPIFRFIGEKGKALGGAVKTKAVELKALYDMDPAVVRQMLETPEIRASLEPGQRRAFEIKLMMSNFRERIANTLYNVKLFTTVKLDDSEAVKKYKMKYEEAKAKPQKAEAMKKPEQPKAEIVPPKQEPKVEKKAEVDKKAITKPSMTINMMEEETKADKKEAKKRAKTAKKEAKKAAKAAKKEAKRERNNKSTPQTHHIPKWVEYESREQKEAEPSTEKGEQGLESRNDIPNAIPINLCNFTVEYLGKDLHYLPELAGRLTQAYYMAIKEGIKDPVQTMIDHLIDGKEVDDMNVMKFLREVHPILEKIQDYK